MELKVALPGDKSYSWYENAYDARAYKRLCTEFGVAPSTDWRQKLDRGCQGLGSWSTYMKPSGAYRHVHYKRVWSASTTVYGRMFGLSSECRPRHARTFSRPGRTVDGHHLVAGDLDHGLLHDGADDGAAVSCSEPRSGSHLHYPT